MPSFEIVRGGDVTRFPAEAIVNAANRYLEHGGGVAYAIARAAAGDVSEYIRISKEAMREQLGKDYIDHGEVVVTPRPETRKTWDSLGYPHGRAVLRRSLG